MQDLILEWRREARGFGKPKQNPSESAVGQKFGKWLVESVGEERGKNRYMHVRCECGHRQEMQLHYLRSGRSRGCKSCMKGA